MKKTLFAALLIVTLTACASAPPTAPVTETPTATQIPATETLSPLPTFTPAIEPSVDFPTFAPVATPIPPYDPTPWPTWTPLPDPLPKFSWDGYVLTFIKDGDLYFQDENNQPVKLTHVGEKSYAKISDDNQKVFFYRNEGDVYSINTDGTQEKFIISRDRQSSIQSQYSNILDFIPHTHLLLVETLRCESKEWGSPCSVSLFIANADTGEIRKLTDAGLAYQKNHIDKNITPSPDGTMIAVGTTEGTDVFSVDGELIRENILPYKPFLENSLLPSIFWLPDSSGITIAIPDSKFDSIAYKRPAYSIWRYSLASNLLIQTPIDPSHIAEEFDISPDGKWIVSGGVTDSEYPLYFGSLMTGQSQIFGASQMASFSWGPDSKYFTYRDVMTILGTVDNPSHGVTICDLVRWIDSRHFICSPIENNTSRLRMAKITAGTAVEIYDLGFDETYEFTVSIMPK